jgi:hypothetical protein
VGTSLKLKMDILSNSVPFNVGGWVTVFGFLGLNVAQISSINEYLSLALGVGGAIFLIMRLYLTFVETKIKKNDLKEQEELKKIKNATDHSDSNILQG